MTNARYEIVDSSGVGQQSVGDQVIEIETPSGFTVRLGQSTDPQTVAQLLTEIHQLDRARKEV